MRIGIIIARIGGLDGVALETTKWIEVLEKAGHKIFLIAGEFENWKIKKANHHLYPALSLHSKANIWEQERAFYKPDESPKELLENIEATSNMIYLELKKWISTNKIDYLLSENASALPCHISLGIGIKKLIEDTKIPTVTHDHDFYWERGVRYKSIHRVINKLIEATFPLLLPNIKHVAINTFGVETFKKRFNIEASMVPNVMDFSKPYASKTKSSRQFLKQLNIEKNDIPIMQVTRIVRRKGIKTAISLIDKLQDKRIKLVIAGTHLDDESDIYYNELISLTHKLNLKDQIIFGFDNGIISHNLSDIYAHSTACTYFSTYEGFGNGLLEIFLAKKPVFLNNYKPVYMQDIGSKGFKTIMLEENQLTNKEVAKMSEIIYNTNLAKEIGEYNFSLGKKYFSFEVLEQKLLKIFKL